MDAAGSGLVQTSQDHHQRGFPDSVGSDQADFVVIGNRDGYPLEQVKRPE